MIGVLVMAYGGPNSLDEVEPYLMDVRGYRPTAPEIIHEVRERYREIGGRSPILEQTQAQASALEAALNTNGRQFKAFVGMRHWHPYIKDTLAEMQPDPERTRPHRGSRAAREGASRAGAAVDPPTIVETLERESPAANSSQFAPLDDDQPTDQHVAS